MTSRGHSLITGVSQRAITLPGSFAGGFALKARQFLHSLSDVLFVIGVVLFAVSGSVAVTVALFILLFVQT